MNRKILVKYAAIFGAAFLLFSGALPAAEGVEQNSRDAIKRGVAFLQAAQNPDGSWGRDFQPPYAPKGQIGITSFILYGTVCGPEGKNYVGQDWFKKALKWVLANQREDGAFVTADGGYENYQTSITVQTLVWVDKDKYKPQIDKAVKFILSQQFAENMGITEKDDPVRYGGIGYGSKKRPDMSNSQMALDALKAAGYDMNSPEMKNLLKFVRRCQDDPEVNDMEWAQVGPGTGGGIYRPAESKAGETVVRGEKKSWRAYGTMTYAMFKSYIHLGMKKDSPELKAALRWIRNEYSVKENPGMGETGYFYYVNTMAKALRTYGNYFRRSGLVDVEGNEHDWAAELAGELAARQREDGSWLNEKSRWWESDPMLCTGYALAALNNCLAFMGERKEFEGK